MRRSAKRKRGVVENQGGEDKTEGFPGKGEGLYTSNAAGDPNPATPGGKTALTRKGSLTFVETHIQRGKRKYLSRRQGTYAGGR